MRQSVRTTALPLSAEPVRRVEIGEIGGPVAALQQSLAERLANSPVGLAPVPQVAAIERLATMASRSAGPIALGFGYGVAMWLLFG